MIGFNPFKSDVQSMISRIANDVSELLGLDLSFEPGQVSNTTDYVGRGHGWVTPGGMDALRLVARTEAMLLDPIHKSKTMAGLIDLVSQGKIASDSTVVFLHTGGFPALFAYSRDLRGAVKETLF